METMPRCLKSPKMNGAPSFGCPGLRHRNLSSTRILPKRFCPSTAKRQRATGVCPASRVAVFASAAAGTKLISSSDIPAFIPRSDLMSEMLRWATIDAGTNGYDKFGMQMKVVPYHKDEEKIYLWGFDILLLADGEEVTRVGVRMDNDTVTKHEFVGYGEGGFPVGEGKETIVEGKTFQIWKMDDAEIDGDTRDTIKSLCTALAGAVAGYYSFGSCFSEDSL